MPVSYPSRSPSWSRHKAMTVQPQPGTDGGHSIRRKLRAGHRVGVDKCQALLMGATW